MASTTINAPFSHAQTEAYTGLPYIFGTEEIKLELQDRLNVLNLGVVSLVGDIARSGSDTIRVTDFGNVGYSLPMTALASETDTVADSPMTLGYEEVTAGQYKMSQAETYLQQVTQREEAVSLERLKGLVVSSWMRTYRDLICAVGAAFSSSVGSVATTLSVDDWLDLATEYRTTLGSKIPTAMLDGTQVDQLLRSFRSEPAFQANSAEFSRLLSLRANGRPADTEMDMIAQLYPDLGGMGIDVAVTDSVTQSGGGRNGFAFSPGGIGWARGSTSPIRPANPQGAIAIDEFGLLIEDMVNGQAQNTSRFQANAFFGASAGSSRVFVQRKILSIV